ncbi:MAG: nucleotidyltransferase [Acidobacteriota bacterium]
MKQIENLLRSLSDADVRYVIIGATAFAAHGWVRATADLDLFVDKDLENIKRVRAVLTDFGYDISDASVEDFQRYKILLRQYDLPLDIHPFVTGVTSFAEVWKRRVTAPIGGMDAPFASLDDIIAMKKAAGRPKDAEDLRQLETLRARRLTED